MSVADRPLDEFDESEFVSPRPPRDPERSRGMGRLEPRYPRRGEQPPELPDLDEDDFSDGPPPLPHERESDQRVTDVVGGLSLRADDNLRSLAGAGIGLILGGLIGLGVSRLRGFDGIPDPQRYGIVAIGCGFLGLILGTFVMGLYVGILGLRRGRSRAPHDR